MAVEVFGVKSQRIHIFKKEPSRRDTVWVDCKCSDGSLVNFTIWTSPMTYIKEMRFALKQMEQAVLNGESCDIEVEYEENVARPETKTDRV